MPYIGKSPLHGNYSKLDSISGSFNGSTTQFALATNGIAVPPVTEAALIISINGVLQEPTTTYTVSGTNITFTSAPASTDTFYGVALGEQLAGNTPSDSTITSAKLSGNLVTPGTLDLNGQELILDADADTSITASTDDQIDFKISGADDFQMTANTFTVLSGSTLTIASGATIANSGTATGFSSADPSSADGDSLGTASAEWSDLYLADGGVIYFGNDQDITLTHVADTGLDLKRTTGDNRYAELTLQTGESDVAVNDLLGKLSFQAPNEGTGTDAILVAAAIQAISEGDFSSSNNATSLQFLTGASEAAAAKMSVTSGGDVKVLTDGASAFFGADSEVELRHVADTGLILKHTATADNKPIVLTLQTGETDMAADDVLGKIDFQAPDEGTGTDAILVSGSIQVVSEGNFSSSANATSMKFFTGNSAAAGSDGGSLILNSTGDLTLKDLRTADGSSPTLTLQTGDTNIAQDDVLGRIAFQAPDEGAGTDALLVGAAIQAVSEGDFSSSNNATKLEFQTGSSEAATTQMTISSGGIVGIGGTLPGDLGVGLHIKTSDSGASVAAAEDELVLESASDVGMALLGGTSSTASIVFGDSSLARSGRILYHLANDTIDFLIGNVTPWHYRSNGRSYIRDTSDATSTIGLTLNQLANDDQIFGLKSSDVAHGVTGSMETDTFFNIQKNGGAAGGTYISSFAENNYNQGLAFNVYAGDPHTTKDNDGYTGIFKTPREKLSLLSEGVNGFSEGAPFIISGIPSWFITTLSILGT